MSTVGNGSGQEPRRRRGRILEKAKRLVSGGDRPFDRLSFRASGNRNRMSAISSLGGESERTPGFLDSSYEERDHWDLDACIDVIETLGCMGGLTEEQELAIRHLRAASGRFRSSPGTPRPDAPAGGEGRTAEARRRNVARREAKFFGIGRKFSYGAKNAPSPLMTKELL
eukprot:CAMPEP_0172539732 /NCGR_PEP_ID=MMETSP1067-20121228/10877_1 /TAXON_ID=265564 ORGANISM="Thalassiosira punctigera, Strain Tpunct2005C2" /NCGR_SAMPLE_ID=MMETSP1067 /ASSEMBLY_ACC=CAM_ASM_000444 /LENGTH=169 /DNA_ID=CAMNT_0013325461 /DNA_START=51 /DNA_END=556 /DNA_ORIENTATION=-